MGEIPGVTDLNETECQIGAPALVGPHHAPVDTSLDQQHQGATHVLNVAPMDVTMVHSERGTHYHHSEDTEDNESVDRL